MEEWREIMSETIYLGDDRGFDQYETASVFNKGIAEESSYLTEALKGMDKAEKVDFLKWVISKKIKRNRG
jgi:hypothetical protein